MKIVSSLLILFSICIFQIKGDNASKVVHYAISKVGCGYLWASSGQKLTESMLNEYAKKYPEHVGKKTCSKWLGKEVFDCSGLVRKAFKTINISLDHNSQSAWTHTNWASKGEIKNYPKDKVCVLYRYDSKYKKMKHTGLYIGGGKFVHAKGSKYGVVMERMPFTWTHWGIPKGLY